MYQITDEHCLFGLLSIIERHEYVDDLVAELSISEFANFVEIIKRIGIKKFLEIVDFALTDDHAIEINNFLTKMKNFNETPAYDRIDTNYHVIKKLQFSIFNMHVIERTFSNFHVIADLYKIPISSNNWIFISCRELIRTAKILPLTITKKYPVNNDRKLILICTDISKYFKIFDVLMETHYNYLILDRILSQYRK